ncbi:MAG: hypothetical protein GY703_06635, partial [Gammaproteobacteria bacterium]|nr:hypothetical protein [Gammaproteobacteria bacterium]
MKPRRVILCTYSSIYSSLVLKGLIEAEGIEIVGIVNSTRIMKPARGWLKGAVDLVSHSGLRYATYLFCLTDASLLLQPLSRLKSVRRLARVSGIPLLDSDDINNEAGHAFLSTLSPDFVLTAYFNQLIQPSLLSLPDTVWLNIHPSLLPAYRGVDPVFFALLRSETHVGVTVHLLDDRFDTGNILKQTELEVNRKWSMFLHYIELFRVGTGLAIDWMMTSGARDTGKFQVGEGSYDSWPESVQVDDF